MEEALMKSIGWVESPYREKFGAPRQSGVVPSGEFILRFHAPFCREEYFRGIEQFSHLWVISRFHLIEERQQAALVRPPKLGGNEKVGVFASRSPFRPNQLCLSVGKLEKKEYINNEVVLTVSGLDLVEGTPIYDIKPYLEYADRVEEANNGYAQTSDAELAISFSRATEEVFQRLSEKDQQLIKEVLRAQPQPGYRNDETVFGLTLKELNIRWKCSGNELEILQIGKEC